MGEIAGDVVTQEPMSPAKVMEKPMEEMDAMVDDVTQEPMSTAKKATKMEKQVSQEEKEKENAEHLRQGEGLETTSAERMEIKEDIPHSLPSTSLSRGARKSLTPRCLVKENISPPIPKFVGTTKGTIVDTII